MQDKNGQVNIAMEHQMHRTQRKADGLFATTPWKFNIAPKNGWLEDEFPFGIPYFQGLC